MNLSLERSTHRVAAGLAVLIAALGLSAPASADFQAKTLSLSPVAANSAWRGQVLDPQTPVVQPVSAWVAASPSGVTNIHGVIDGTGPTCLSGDSQVALDLGRETGGVITLHITSADPNTDLVLSYSETKQYLSPSGDFAPAAYSGSIVRTETITPSGGAQTWTSPGIRAGERYIMLSLSAQNSGSTPSLPTSSQGGGTPGRVCVQALSITVSNLRPAISDYAGHFLSSDPLLNKAWYSGAYTYDLDSIQGCCGQWVVVDGAKRDRQLWAGDLSFAGPTGAYTTRAGLKAFRDTLAAFSCYTYPGGYMADSAAPSSSCQGRSGPVDAQPGGDYAVYAAFPVIGAYEALTVIAADEYWMASGDDAFIKDMLPQLRGAMSWMQAHMINGLYEATPNEWQWTASFTRGASSFTNAAMIIALRDLAAMERRDGSGESAASADLGTADSIASAMRAQLYDPAAEAFVVDDMDQSPNHTQDANAGAILAGVVSGNQAARALAYLKRHLWTKYGTNTGEIANDSFMPQWISPFMSGFELEARFQSGDTQDALNLLRRTWGHMVYGDPGGTVWETVSLDGQQPAGENSMAHGWSSGPTWLLSQYVLGTRPTSPGYRTWLIAPQPGDLRWAQGSSPTPEGPLVSRWEAGPGQHSFRSTVSAPTGTQGAVVIPTFGRKRQIWRDGVLVWNGSAARNGASAHADPAGVVFTEVSGQHTFAWGQAADR